MGMESFESRQQMVHMHCSSQAVGLCLAANGQVEEHDMRGPSHTAVFMTSVKQQQMTKAQLRKLEDLGQALLPVSTLMKQISHHVN